MSNKESGVVILTPAETKFDASNAVAVRERIARETPPGGKAIVDLANVTFVDSSGVGVLLHVLRHHRESGGQIVFTGIQPQVRQILDIVCFRNVADVADDLSQAKALLRTS